MRGFPHWLAALPLSVAVHAAIVFAAVTLLRTTLTEPALILDLNAIVAGRGDGADQEAFAAARPSPARAAPRAAIAPAPPSAAPRPPFTSPDVAEPRPAASPESRTPAPPPAPAPETPTRDVAAPSRTLPSTEALATVAGREAARTTDGRRSDTGIAPGHATGVPEDATGRGGTGAREDQIAAVAPGIGAGGGAAVDSEYTAYLAGLRRRIQESLRYPAAARRRQVSGTVQLEIAIAPDGGIASVSVVASSSHELLDRAAVDAARSLPRVPFPPDVRPRALTVRLPVVFELQ